ncbi:MAG: acyl-CoA dehydrogenase [Alphaproteobacteria bacterium]|nr:acyl-CoA dehydrogenase [Alphaproteobacteria bacterium]
MDFELPEELRMLKQTVRSFVDKEIIPIEMTAMDRHDLKPEVRAALEKKAKELGLWMLDVPTEYGGQGLSMLGLVVVWEEIARTVGLPPRGPLIFGPDPRPILFMLNEKQKEKYLYPVLRGEKKATFCQTEPDAGGDPGSMRTTAVRQGDHYILNGYKRFISHVDIADFLQVVCATDRSKGSRGGLSVLLVDKDTPGVKITRSTYKMMGDLTFEIAFDDVKVPVENLIGEEGAGMARAQKWLTMGRLYQACRGLGVAQRSLELAVKYSKQRVTFGRPVADRQAIQFMLADIYMKHEMCQNFVYRTAWRSDQDTLERHEPFMCKVYGTELGFEAADRCLQIHGGLGLTVEMPTQKMWRDARGFMITEGPVEIMRSVIARHVFRAYE